jgi:hypothetical protein
MNEIGMASFAEIWARTAEACNVVVSTADMLICRELGEQDEASLSAPGRRRHRKPSRSRAGPAAYHLSPCLAYPFSALSIANRAAPTYRAVSSLDPFAPKILRQHSLIRKSERTGAMASFLSLPDEVLLTILKIAFSEHG